MFSFDKSVIADSNVKYCGWQLRSEDIKWQVPIESPTCKSVFTGSDEGGAWNVICIEMMNNTNNTRSTSNPLSSINLDSILQPISPPSGDFFETGPVT